MLSLDITDEDSAGCCLLDLFIPKRSCCFSSLKITTKNVHQQCGFISDDSSKKKKIPYLIKRTESPAKSLFVLTKTLQPVVNRCLFGCPVTNVDPIF